MIVSFPFVYLPWRNFDLDALPIFKFDFLSFYQSFKSYLYILDGNSYQIHALQIFPPILWIVFSLS